MNKERTHHIAFLHEKTVWLSWAQASFRTNAEVFCSGSSRAGTRKRGEGRTSGYCTPLHVRLSWTNASFRTKSNNYEHKPSSRISRHEEMEREGGKKMTRTTRLKRLVIFKISYIYTIQKYNIRRKVKDLPAGNKLLTLPVSGQLCRWVDSLTALGLCYHPRR